MGNRARNRVIAGEYHDKMVSRAGTTLCIISKIAQTIDLDRSNVDEIELIDETSEVSRVGAATRGFIGELLFGPIGLAAAATARRDEVHTVEITFKDGRKSTLELDGELYALLLHQDLPVKKQG